MIASLEVMKHETTRVIAGIEAGEKIEKMILQGQKGKFYEHLSFFLPLTSLPEAIYSAYHMRSFEKDSTSKLTKKSAYPLFIFILSSASIYLFTTFIIPQLLNGFSIETNNILFDFLNVIQWISTLAIILLFLFIIVVIILNKNKNLHNWSYCNLIRYFSFVKEYLSYYLSGYLKELRNHGFSSKEAINYMKYMQGEKYLSYLCKDLNEGLNQGKDMQDLIQSSLVLDQNFKLHYAIGVLNTTLDDSLNSYLETIELKWNHMITKISMGIQILSYSFVGILMICVYQIMLLPLEMLNQL